MSGVALVEERVLGGEWLANEVHPGDFFLTTSREPCELRWRTLTDEPFKVVHLYLGLPLMRSAALDMHGAGGRLPVLREISGGTDPVVTTLVQLLSDELVHRRQPSAMLVQGIAGTLAVHLVRGYASEAPAPTAPHGGLPAHKIHRALASMHQRMDQELDLARLAKEAQLSDAHFSRSFKKSTGFSPSQYLTRMRVEKARSLLRETDMPIVEVGLEVGYASPSHFAQAFRKEVGVSPSDYRGSRQVQ